mgnify:CR=1 FL=1
MRMKNPAHPGRILKAALDDIGITVPAAASGIGISRQQLSNVIGGRSGITPEMAVRLELGIGSTAETWLDMQRAFDLAQVRAHSGEIASSVRRLSPV